MKAHGRQLTVTHHYVVINSPKQVLFSLLKKNFQYISTEIGEHRGVLCLAHYCCKRAEGVGRSTDKMRRLTEKFVGVKVWWMMVERDFDSVL